MNQSNSISHPNESNDVPIQGTTASLQSKQDTANSFDPNKVTSKFNLMDFNDECLEHIVKNLGYRDLVLFARTSRRAKVIAKRTVHRMFVANIFRPLERIQNELQYLIRTHRR